MPLDLTPAISEVILLLSGLALLVIGAFRDEEPARLLAPRRLNGVDT